MLFESFKRTLAAAAISFALVILPSVVAAQVPATTGSVGFPATTGTVSGGGSGPATCGSGPCPVSNPLGSTTTLCGLIKKLFQAAVAIAIPVAVLFIIWSGFQFVLAQGRPKDLQRAKRHFYYTIIGIAIFLGSWLLATVIAATINSIGGSNIISCN